MNNDTHNYFA